MAEQFETEADRQDLVKSSRREDLARAQASLAMKLPPELGVFARLAYNYRWSWHVDGPSLFRAIDPVRWQSCGGNPVALLEEASSEALARAANDQELVSAANSLWAQIEAELEAPTDTSTGIQADPDRACTVNNPIAFFCAEYAIHESLPIYSGGLGVLAGDFLKQASDSRVPLVAVGLMYHKGYFRQRIDMDGVQQESWLESDPSRLPAVLVSDAHSSGADPLRISVPICGREVLAQVWRVDVGRVPLYLLDTDLEENLAVDRWITGRLYVGDRTTRLAQYMLLGVGGIRALHAMGIDPGRIHLNEGHAAFGPLELARRAIAQGADTNQAIEDVRQRTVFTTHTPVPAGNDTYLPGEISAVLGDFPKELCLDIDTFLALGRTSRDSSNEPFGMTQLGLHVSRTANGVSRRHGVVARTMWQDLFPKLTVDQVPITHVTNGVHVPTWMSEPMQQLLTHKWGSGWQANASDANVWSQLDSIPDEDLWQVRQNARRKLVAEAGRRAINERLIRGEKPDYAESLDLDPAVLTIGIARRMTAYKRLSLLTHDLDQLLQLLAGDHPIQILVAGKAHPEDIGGKDALQSIVTIRYEPNVGRTIAVLEDYDLELAALLVSGCDVWLNLPRPPLEASGTSGMKAALNGSLNLSVLDGWWAEAFDAENPNGWAIEGDVNSDPVGQDNRDASALYGLLHDTVSPLFYDRDSSGIPQDWLKLIRASMRSVSAQFNAQRMLDDYLNNIY